MASVAVSLCCVGIEGVVKFWNVELRPMNSAATGRLEEYFMLHLHYANTHTKTILHTHAHTHEYTHAYAHTHTYTYPHTHTTCTYTLIHAHTHACMHARTHTRTHTHAHTHTALMSVYSSCRNNGTERRLHCAVSIFIIATSSTKTHLQ